MTAASKTNMATKYKIKGPIGTIVVPKAVMTEAEVRAFMPQLVQDTEQAEIWKEKAAKDPIEELVEWLMRSGYVVETIES